MPPSNRLLGELRNLIALISESANELDDAESDAVSQFLENAFNRVRALQQEEQAALNQVPQSAQLLWNAAGRQVKPFISFLQNYPDPELNAIRNNPQALFRIVRTLSDNFPPEPPQEANGFTESEIPSSNVFGFAYDPSQKQLFVKFNGKDNKEDGPIYAYDNVPEQIFKIFAAGSIPAKTNGNNRWGQWWRGKKPSIGASHNDLIKKGGFPFRKVS